MPQDPFRPCAEFRNKTLLVFVFVVVVFSNQTTVDKVQEQFT